MSPLGTLGTTILNWYSPGATSPANTTLAATPPMVAVTVLAVGGAPLNVWPKSVVGLVGPKPVPNSSSVSPALAGTVRPGYRLAGPMYCPSERTAATYFAPSGENMNSAGAKAASVPFSTLLVLPA